MNLIELNKIDTSQYHKYLPDHLHHDFDGFAGKEHYRLLNHICQGKSLVFDIGTYRGSSSIAMTSAKKVISYDVENLREVTKHKRVTYRIGDATQDDKLLSADVILLDTNHDGEFEEKLYNKLKEGFSGILIVDDIRVNQPMRKFWGSIIHPKEDITDIGHYSGTGIVYFDRASVKRCRSCG